jgi:hypothetical protein
MKGAGKKEQGVPDRDASPANSAARLGLEPIKGEALVDEMRVFQAGRERDGGSERREEAGDEGGPTRREASEGCNAPLLAAQHTLLLVPLSPSHFLRSSSTTS